MHVSEIINEKNWMKLALREMDDRHLTASEQAILLDAIAKEKSKAEVAMRQAEAIKEQAYTKGQNEASLYERQRLAVKALKETNWTADKIATFFELNEEDVKRIKHELK